MTTWEERVKTEYTFRKLVWEDARRAWRHPKDWNADMDHRTATNPNGIDFTQAKIGELPLRRRIRNTWGVLKARTPMWLALFICRDLREELELR